MAIKLMERWLTSVMARETQMRKQNALPPWDVVRKTGGSGAGRRDVHSGAMLRTPGSVLESWPSADPVTQQPYPWAPARQTRVPFPSKMSVGWFALAVGDSTKWEPPSAHPHGADQPVLAHVACPPAADAAHKEQRRPETEGVTWFHLDEVSWC